MTEKKWFLVDAKDKVVGRLATQIATVLIGKNKRSILKNLQRNMKLMFLFL